MAALELDKARDEDFHLRYVYDVLVLTDLDLDDLRDFAVPDIVSMLRVRSDYMLTTVITVSAGNSGDLERDSKLPRQPRRSPASPGGRRGQLRWKVTTSPTSAVSTTTS